MGPVAAELDRRAVAPRDIGQQLDHLLADPGQVGPQLHQYLGGHPFALTDEAEQDVLGADVVVTELQRLAQRQLEHVLGAPRELEVAAGRRSALTDDLLDLAADRLERDAQRLEGGGRHALPLVDETEKEVLGADLPVVQTGRLFLGEDHGPPGSVGEPFEHGTASRPLGAAASLRVTVDVAHGARDAGGYSDQAGGGGGAVFVSNVPLVSKPNLCH